MEKIIHLKEKWIIKWVDVWEMKEREQEIQCQVWFSSEKDAMNFLKEWKSDKPRRCWTK